MSSFAIFSMPDLDAVKNILAAAHLPTGDLTEEHCQHFFHAGDAERPAGIVGVEIFGATALLRSLVVRERERGAGLGSALVAHAERYARTRGVRSIYLLTTTAEDFFASLGYATASREHAPGAIKTTREFATICPASSTFMSKQL